MFIGLRGDLDFLLDDPFAIFSQSLHAVDHVGQAMLHFVPNVPALGSKPVSKDEATLELSLCEPSSLEHDGIDVLAKG